jgi:aminomuconate-semialdehyde/2-hydroxymuconate-6-semialdehyde dehydrogenase
MSAILFNSIMYIIPVCLIFHSFVPVLYANVKMIEILNYINGSMVPAKSGNVLMNPEPATGKIFSTLPDSNSEDIEVAIQAAKSAFPAWKNMTAEKRFKILNTIAEGIEANLDELAKAESQDNGKPIHLAMKVDIPRAATNFRFFAAATMHFTSESHDMPGLAINYTLRQAIGVVACISPWNLPLYLFSWKIAPALAAGNTVVAKPSEITPYTAFLLSQICIKAGLPPGVLNIVHGTGPNCGQALVEHPEIKAISFTGGTATGQRIASIAAPKFKKLSLELGGKNPTIVFDDADFDDAVKTAVSASYSNQGQICLCGSRLYVQRGIYDRFLSEFVNKVNLLKTGDPSDPQTDIGAVVSREHMEKVMSYIELAKKEGGQILSGGTSVKVPGRCAEGWFIQPTVITGLDNSCRTNQEEIFGPVVTIQVFETEEEVLQLANDSRYGLACSIWTQDLKRAHRIAHNIESGIVWINCWLLRDLRTSFGGMKDSGVGREGGWEAMRFFTEPKNVCIKY